MRAFILSLSFCLISTLSMAQSVTFNVTTATDNGSFSPKHVLAIWVKDANGNFVKSLKVMANTRIQYLYKWNKSSAGNKVDAITGATLTSHQSHTVTWNCKNTSNAIVPDGTYKMMIEFTDMHAQGPIDSISFTISSNSQHLTQTDQSYFKNISLDFTPVSTGVTDNQIGNQTLSIFPNPNRGQFFINFTTEEKGDANLKVFEISGRLIHSETISISKLTNYPININNYSRGIHIVEISINGKKISQKINLD